MCNESFYSLNPDYVYIDSMSAKNNILQLNPSVYDSLYYNNSEWQGYPSAKADGEYEYYITDCYGVYGMNGEGDLTLLCEWSSSAVVYSDIEQFIPIESGRFACLAVNWATGDKELLILTRGEDITLEREIITVIALNPLEPFIINAIDRYNLINKEVRVETANYSQLNTAYNPNAGYSKYLLDLASGKTFDIGIEGFYAVTDDKYYCDLYEFFEKDEEVSVDSMIKAIALGGDFRGKMYTVGLIADYCTDCVNVGYFDGEAISFEDVYAAEARAAENDGRVFIGMNKSSVLKTMLEGSFTRFVDYESLKCDFDSEDFINLLKYCGTYPETLNEIITFYPYEESYNGMAIYGISAIVSGDRMTFREGKALYKTQCNIISTNDYSYMRFLFGDKFHPANVSYPGKKPISAHTAVGIYKNSKHKDSSWNFIKFMLSDEIQQSIDGYYAPVTVSGLRKYLEGKIGEINVYDNATMLYYKNYTTYIDDEGNEQFVYGPEEEYTKYVFERDDVEYIISYFNDGEFSSAYDYLLMQIVSEETAAFFAGDKTAEETAKVIQNRASTYVSEKYG